jgi:hypothetical protein
LQGIHQFARASFQLAQAFGGCHAQLCQRGMYGLQLAFDFVMKI